MIADRVDLSNRSLGPDGLRRLLPDLSQDGVRHLLLGGNRLGPEGALLVADLVRDHPSLVTLHLEDNGIGPYGAKALADALAGNRRISALWLERNRLGSEGACALIDALEINRSLTILQLGELPRETQTYLNGLLCRNANAAPRKRALHAQPIVVKAQQLEPKPAPKLDRPRTSEAERGFSDEDLLRCTRVIEALSIRREVMEELPELRDLMTRLLRTARPKPEKKPRPAVDPDRAVLAPTGVRRRTGTAIELTEPRHLERARGCYICKQSFTEVHHFYGSLCPACAELSWEKRSATADLTGKVALVTGGRIKIGFQIVLKLLAAGASVIVTTRFPRDARRRFDEAGELGERLRVEGLDLLNLPHVEAFARQLADREPRLDYLIQNAAQTLYRPPAFYAELRAKEDPTLPAPWSPHQLLAPVDQRLFPAGTDDGHGQPIDLRSKNSWRMRIDEVDTRELLTVNVVNAIAPYLLVARLRGLMAKTAGDKFVINVSAVEGQFGRINKTTYHPHTNMAKAALNMITRTSAEDLATDRIYLSSVDPGWFSNENPHPIAEGMKAAGFTLPVDEIDGAARVLDPIFSRMNGGEPIYGCFIKDYQPAVW